MGETAELIEVFANEKVDSFLVASHFLIFNDLPDKQILSIAIAKGKTFTLTIERSLSDEDMEDENFFEISVIYSYNNSFVNALSLQWNFIKNLIKNLRAVLLELC